MAERLLNLGCGQKPIEGAVNHDRIKHHDYVDVAHDLNDLPWPWENNSFDKIAAIAVLEHLDIDLVTSLNECHRLLRPGGQLVIKLPLWNADRAHDDPTHRWYYTVRALDQFCPETQRGRDYAFYTPHKWRYVKRPRPNNSRTSFFATLEKLEDA